MMKAIVSKAPFRPWSPLIFPLLLALTLSGCGKAAPPRQPPSPLQLSMEEAYSPSQMQFTGAPWGSGLQETFDGLGLSLPLAPAIVRDNQAAFQVPVEITDWEAQGFCYLRFSADDLQKDTPLTFAGLTLYLAFQEEAAWEAFFQRLEASYAEWGKANPDFSLLTGGRENSVNYITSSVVDGTFCTFGGMVLPEIQNSDLAAAYGGRYRIRLTAALDTVPGAE